MLHTSEYVLGQRERICDIRDLAKIVDLFDHLRSLMLCGLAIKVPQSYKTESRGRTIDKLVFQLPPYCFGSTQSFFAPLLLFERVRTVKFCANKPVSMPVDAQRKSECSDSVPFPPETLTISCTHQSTGSVLDVLIATKPWHAGVAIKTLRIKELTSPSIPSLRRFLDHFGREVVHLKLDFRFGCACELYPL